LVAGGLGVDDAPSDVLNLLGIAYRRAAILLDNKRQGLSPDKENGGIFNDE
jgi:hypothetical protein